MPPAIGGIRTRLFLLFLVAAIGIVAFLGIRPHQTWILWFTAGLIALAVDGTVRSSPSWEPAGFVSGLAFTLLPATAVIASGLFIDEALDGYVRPAAGIVAAAAVTGVAFGEYKTVDFEARYYGLMRLYLAVATYLAAFATFAIVYGGDFEVPLSAAIVGLVSAALAIELLRESRLIDRGSLFVGFAVGLSLAELRIALYFFPLDGLLAGALLIIGFYVATSLVHHLVDRDLHFVTLAEYAIVAAVGSSAVVVARVTLGA
jgi:hypothetical protein